MDKQTILNIADDQMSDFLYYGRKESETLPLNAVEDAIIDGVVTVDEIMDVMRGIIECSVQDRVRARYD